jgi:hypothetical protein
LLAELRPAASAPEALAEKARVLDTYIPARYPNGHPEGAPFEHYGALQSGERFDMPVRSLNSYVLAWPDRMEVERAVRE